LKLIPLWPRFQTSFPERLLSASDALMAVSYRLLVPWMKDCHRFVKTQSAGDRCSRDCLLKLGVRELSVEVLLRDHVLPLPTELSAIHWQNFQPLIAAISELSSSGSSNVILALLTGSKIAADGNRDLRKADELYDHEDQIFVSAFRQQKKTKFLHDSVKGYRSFWLKVGLRRRNGTAISSSHYLQCLQELKLRLNTRGSQNDPHLSQDSQTVLSILTTLNSSTQPFSARDWQAISQERVFQSRTIFNSEYEYRRDTMASVAAEQRILRLSDIISHAHMAVCWSQTSFAIYEPTREVLGKVPGSGQPKIDMVWRHLQHMARAAQHLKRYQARDFLTDLHLTYEYLQDHLDESRAYFNIDLKTSTIWLNLNTLDHNMVLLDDIKSSWQGIGDLVLSSSCDAGPVKAVRAGLMRYERLLRVLGCSSLTYPTVTRPTLHLSSSVSNSLRKLRNEGKLLDVTYSTEGQLIKAHRVVLAAISEKCALQFSGRWRIEDVIEFDSDNDPDGFLSYHTLSTMINYAYEDEIDWKEMEVSDNDDADEIEEKLDLLLDLCKGADYWLIPALKSQVEDKILVAGKLFINLENVIAIRERASEVGAMAVEQMCARFIEQNQEAVAKAHSRVR
jgi:sacsin